MCVCWHCIDGNHIPRTFEGTLSAGVHWTIGDGTLTISGIGEITWSETELFPPWRKYKDIVSHVVVEEGISQLPAYSLPLTFESILLPDSIESISSHAFEKGAVQCRILRLPAHVQTIHSRTIWYWEHLSSVTMPKYPDLMLESGAFSYCQNLKELLFPEGILHLKFGTTLIDGVKDGPLHFCSLSRITLPSTLKYITGDIGQSVKICFAGTMEQAPQVKISAPKGAFIVKKIWHCSDGDYCPGDTNGITS